MFIEVLTLIGGVLTLTLMRGDTVLLMDNSVVIDQQDEISGALSIYKAKGGAMFKLTDGKTYTFPHDVHVKPVMKPGTVAFTDADDIPYCSIPKGTEIWVWPLLYVLRGNIEATLLSGSRKLLLTNGIYEFKNALVECRSTQLDFGIFDVMLENLYVPQGANRLRIANQGIPVEFIIDQDRAEYEPVPEMVPEVEM